MERGTTSCISVRMVELLPSQHLLRLRQLPDRTLHLPATGRLTDLNQGEAATRALRALQAPQTLDLAVPSPAALVLLDRVLAALAALAALAQTLVQVQTTTQDQSPLLLISTELQPPRLLLRQLHRPGIQAVADHLDHLGQAAARIPTATVKTTTPVLVRQAQALAQQATVNHTVMGKTKIPVRVLRDQAPAPEAQVRAATPILTVMVPTATLRATLDQADHLDKIRRLLLRYRPTLTCNPSRRLLLLLVTHPSPTSRARRLALPTLLSLLLPSSLVRRSCLPHLPDLLLLPVTLVPRVFLLLATRQASSLLLPPLNPPNQARPDRPVEVNISTLTRLSLRRLPSRLIKETVLREENTSTLTHLPLPPRRSRSIKETVPLVGNTFTLTLLLATPPFLSTTRLSRQTRRSSTVMVPLPRSFCHRTLLQ